MSSIEIFWETVSVDYINETTAMAGVTIAGKFYMALYGSILLVLGIPGNILTIVVLQKRALKDNFLSVFLSALAVFDLLCLVVGLGRHYVTAFTNYNIEHYSEQVCFHHLAIIKIFLTIQHWLIVGVSFYRVYYIKYGRTALKYNNPIFAYILIGILVLFSIVSNYLLVYNRLEINYSSNRKTITTCQKKNIILAAVIHQLEWAILPAVILFIINGYMLISFNKIAAQSDTSVYGKQKKIREQLNTLVILSDLLMMLSITPYLLNLLLTPVIFDMHTPTGRQNAALSYTVNVGFLYTGPAVNFAVYCFFGTRFRLEFMKILPKYLTMGQLQDEQDQVTIFHLT